MSWLRGACTSCDRAPASERGACTSWLRGAWTSWLRGACTSCDRAPARERGACTSWLLAVCVSMAFADATSGGQEVCAIPTVAESETAVITLNTVASTFLIASILSDFVSDCVFLLGSPLRASGPLGPRFAAFGCRLGATEIPYRPG